MQFLRCYEDVVASICLDSLRHIKMRRLSEGAYREPWKAK